MDFPSNVKQQYEAVGRFIEILNQEQSVLTAASIDGARLSTLTEDKSACAAKLESLEQARQEILTKQGYSADRTGAEKLAKAMDCMPLWRAFVERVDQARAYNDMNGAVIGQRLDFNQQAMTFLDNISGGGLYGPDGQTNSAGGKHFHHSV